MVMYVHKQETADLDINAICEEFVSRKDSRRALFGYYKNDAISLRFNNTVWIIHLSYPLPTYPKFR